MSDGKSKGYGNRKNGNRYLSWALTEAVQLGRRYNEQFRRYYNRKAAQANTSLATKALGNKLARICYYVMRDRVPFREELKIGNRQKFYLFQRPIDFRRLGTGEQRIGADQKDHFHRVRFLVEHGIPNALGIDDAELAGQPKSLAPQPLGHLFFGQLLVGAEGAHFDDVGCLEQHLAAGNIDVTGNAHQGHQQGPQVALEIGSNFSVKMISPLHIWPHSKLRGQSS